MRTPHFGPPPPPRSTDTLVLDDWLEVLADQINWLVAELGELSVMADKIGRPFWKQRDACKRFVREAFQYRAAGEVPHDHA